MNKTDFKVALCGINLEYFDDSVTTINYDTFAKLIDKYSRELPQIKEYESHLWKFGHCLYLDKIDFETPLFPSFQYAIDLLEKAKFLIDNQNAKIRVTNKGSIAQSIELENPKYIKVLLEEVWNEIEELKLNTFMIIKKNEEEFIVNDREMLVNELSEAYESCFKLEQRDLLDKKIDQLRYWRVKDGEDKRKKPVKKFVHMGIHALALLLRIDEYYANRNILDSIDEIKLSNAMCRFIADYLILFNLYDSQDFLQSSKPYLTIRNLYRQPPKDAAPMLYKEIMKITNGLNDTIKKIRVVKYPPEN